MKRHILSLLAVLLITATSFARHTRQELIIETDRNFPILVHVDGICYNDVPQNQVVITDLRPGNHHLKVEVIGRRGSQIIRENIDLLPNHLTVYDVVQHGRGDFCLELAECAPLNQGCGFDQRRRYGIDQNRLRGRTLQGYRYGFDDNFRRGRSYGTFRGSTVGRRGAPIGRVGHPGRGAGLDVNLLIRSLNDTPFDRDRLELAKSAISRSGGGLSSAEVQRLAEEFSFDRNRLEFAKFAFAYTFDKHNYFIVNDALVFSSSRRELSRFISLV